MENKTVVNIHDAKTRLSELLARVVRGEEIVIAKANRPIARLVAIDQIPSRRHFGKYREKIWPVKISTPLDMGLGGRRSLNLLLDTHAFLWLMESPDKIPAKVLRACESPSNRCSWNIPGMLGVSSKNGDIAVRREAAHSDKVWRRYSTFFSNEFPTQDTSSCRISTPSF